MIRGDWDQSNNFILTETFDNQLIQPRHQQLSFLFCPDVGVADDLFHIGRADLYGLVFYHLGMFW